MGAPMPDMDPVENASAEALLDSLKTIDPGERRRHASVFNYWQSIRGNRPFPPIRDLDPLEISDAGPWSILLEMIGGGEDAVIRHFGQEIRDGLDVEKIGDAPNPSLLAAIHAKLPIVAACREAFAFEESYVTADGPRRCWVTLLPFSQTGSWIDFVYGYVSLEGAKGAAEPTAEDEPEAVADKPEAVADEPEAEAEFSEAVDELPEPDALVEEQAVEQSSEPFQVDLRPSGAELEAAQSPSRVVPMIPEAELEPEPEFEPQAEIEPEPEVEPEPQAELEPEPEPDLVEEAMALKAFAEPASQPEPAFEPDEQSKPRFSAKFLEGLASSFYGKVTHSEPTVSGGYADEDLVETMPIEPAEQVSEPASNGEGHLHSKLSEVRTLAAEAREAQVRSNIALYEGLSAAYDFALDAEGEPEEYLRLVEAQGLKIQLRSPMKPVVKLAFDGMCDEPTIKQLEAVLAWALKQDLPRGTLADRIQEEGGIGQILNGKAAA